MTRQSRPERLRIFIGCEGQSERSYCTFLYRLALDRQLPVFVDPQMMDEGDPLARLQWVARNLSRFEDRRGVYAHKFAFLDMDQRRRDPERAARAMALAGDLGIQVIWQDPDHEGLLLQHFEHDVRRWPSTAEESMRHLLRQWPGYTKNSPSLHYERKLDLTHVLRTGRRHPDFTHLLRAIGLIEPA